MHCLVTPFFRVWLLCVCFRGRDRGISSSRALNGSKKACVIPAHWFLKATFNPSAVLRIWLTSFCCPSEDKLHCVSISCWGFSARSVEVELVVAVALAFWCAPMVVFCDFVAIGCSWLSRSGVLVDCGCCVSCDKPGR